MVRVGVVGAGRKEEGPSATPLGELFELVLFLLYAKRMPGQARQKKGSAVAASSSCGPSPRMLLGAVQDVHDLVDGLLVRRRHVDSLLVDRLERFAGPCLA
jgi:hypothetical protein